MIDRQTQVAICSELERGNVMTMLTRLMETCDPSYAEVCFFVLAWLRRRYQVPPTKHAGFYVSYERWCGTTIECQWHECGRDWIQEVGSAWRHPEPIVPNVASVAAQNFMGIQFRGPKRETR